MCDADETKQTGENDKAREQIQEESESIATLFSAFQAVTIHSQENKSFALNNFLLFNSFLLMGWATLFSQEEMWMDLVASTLLCIVGILIAKVWRGLLKDYSNSSDNFRRYIEKFEKYLPLRWHGPHAGRKEQIDKRDEKVGQQGLGKEIGSRDLMAFIPYAFIAIYLVPT